MDTKLTAATYDRIAPYWASDEFDRTNGIAQHRKAIGFLDARGPAIDVGCGSSGRIIELLLEHGFAVEGLDISTEMLSLARQKHPSMLLHHGDICQWSFDKQYDFISAWDSIWHAPLDLQPMVIRKLCLALAPGGVLILSAGGADEPDERTNPCLGHPLYHSSVGIPKLLRVIDDSDTICRHLEYDQGPEEEHLCVIVQKMSP